uniref:Lipoprotein n=1 Tax=Panagrellus redivivus TaxID=6233 RepID=A0A7E4V281_PANRE
MFRSEHASLLGSLHAVLGAVLFIGTTVLLSLVNCTKKSGPAATNNASAAKVGGAGGTPGTPGGLAPGNPASARKSVQGTPAAAPSPAGSITPGTGESRDGGNKTAEKSKKSGEKVEGADPNNNDKKEKEEDSFEQHKPVVREAKRADEIKKHGPVDQKRKDYKTIRHDLPSSDFDKSLGLPNQEDKDKDGK